MVYSVWRYTKCKLGGYCSHLEDTNLASRLLGYLTLSSTTPATILLAVAVVAVSAALVYFKPNPRQVFQKVKSALRMGPKTSAVVDENVAHIEQIVNPGGDPDRRVPPLGVPVYPPEVYQDGVSIESDA